MTIVISLQVKFNNFILYSKISNHIRIIKIKHVSHCKYVGNNLIVATRYEHLFLEYHLRFFGRLIEIIIYLVLLSMLILWKLVKICFIFAHRWISISPAQWLI